jgi:sugar lactone lactonase YvrE
LSACGSSAVPGVAPVEHGFASASLFGNAQANQNVYWTLFASSVYPQVQFATIPLIKRSKVTSIYNNAYNLLAYSSGLHVDKAGRLWILAFGPYNGNPGTVSVFTLPLTPKSAPVHTFVLLGTADPDHLTFNSGHLWVNSHYNNAVLEYTGPFNQSGTLSPALALTDGISSPSGIAFDKKGNLYVSNINSTGNNSIAVFKAPISDEAPYFLDGLQAPGGLIFDKAGNLYASDNVSALSAIVRYDRSNLKSGAMPNIVDKTGLKQTYEADFALSASGDLYFANCGTHAGIIGYATSTKPFSSKLAPSVRFSDVKVRSAGCAWGIAIK